MGDGPAPDNRHTMLEPDPVPAAESLSEDQLLSLYRTERAARLDAERQRDIALRERSDEQESAAVRDYVMASAHCLLWYAEIRETNGRYLDWRMAFPNIEAARRFLPLEIRANETVQEAWYLRRHPEDREECDRVGTTSVRAGASYQQEFRCYCEDGSIRWLHEDVHVETIATGRQWRAVGVCTDITAFHELQARMQATNKRLKRSVAETHHRVKNNLQVVAALVDLQVSAAGQTAEEQSGFRRMGQHIRALSAMHDLLTHEARSGSDVDSVSIRAVLEKLVALFQQTVTGRTIQADVQDIRLPSRQVTALVVLVNELLSNAVKHSRGDISISLEIRNGFVRIEVCDDGPGFPTGFDPIASGKTGLEIVESIGLLDLQASLTYETRPQGGGRVSLEFLPGVPAPA